MGFVAGWPGSRLWRGLRRWRDRRREMALLAALPAHDRRDLGLEPDGPAAGAATPEAARRRAASGLARLRTPA